jgi:hypothetical protein
MKVMVMIVADLNDALELGVHERLDLLDPNAVAPVRETSKVAEQRNISDSPTAGIKQGVMRTDGLRANGALDSVSMRVQGMPTGKARRTEIPSRTV